MTNFVNRTDELARLESWYSGAESGLGIVWGRRRVGKTMLIQRFSEEKRAVFHTAAGRPLVDELRFLSDAVATVAPQGLRDLSARPFTSWDDALEYCASAASETPLLLVLDEFPELATTTPEIEGILRAFFDRAESLTKLRVLVCGSAVRTMSAMQEERSALYGRFGLQLKVQPFGPHEAAMMLPDASAENRAIAWGLLGGMPLYLSLWNGKQSLRQNIRRLFCEPSAPLLNEAQLVLATEGDLTGLAGSALRAIAAGRTKHNQIKDALGIDPSRLLKRLIELDLVEQMVPITEDPAHTRRKTYRIADNFLSFWLSRVERYRPQIERGLGEPVANVLVDGVNDAMGAPWEEAFRRHLIRMVAAGELPEIVALGSWWNDDGDSVEIDAVGLAGRSREAVLLGEAKWAQTKSAAALVGGLQAKAVRVPGLVADPVFAVAARTELTDVTTGVVALTAEDIFGLPEASQV